jgi:hypothetical protein
MQSATHGSGQTGSPSTAAAGAGSDPALQPDPRAGGDPSVRFESTGPRRRRSHSAPSPDSLRTVHKKLIFC